MRAEVFCGLVGTQREQFVAQRQKAARFKSDDRHTACGEAGVGRNQPVQFVARLINEPGRKKGSPAAYRAGWPGRLREMDPIAALDQHAQGRIEVLALIDAIEGIGEQHDFAPVFRPERLGGGLERVATECR